VVAVAVSSWSKGAAAVRDGVGDGWGKEKNEREDVFVVHKMLLFWNQ